MLLRKTKKNLLTHIFIDSYQFKHHVRNNKRERDLLEILYVNFHKKAALNKHPMLSIKYSFTVLNKKLR